MTQSASLSGIHPSKLSSMREGSAFFVLTPDVSYVYVEFLSSGSNYNIYLAKGPLQLLTDRIQEPCTTASCLQGHVFWTLMIHNTFG